MRFAPALVLVLSLASGGAAEAVPAAAEEGVLPPLEVNPFKAGLAGWEAEGGKERAAKAFAYDPAGSTLAVKGPPGREAPAIWYAGIAWDRVQWRLRVRKGSRRVRLLLRPADGGEAVALEVPRGAVKDESWNEVVLRARDGRAALHHDGKEVAEAAVPAGVRLRVGLEAVPGSDGAVTDLRLRREYENDPPVAEEGFTSLFDGKTLAPWAPADADAAGTAAVREGLLVVEVRAVDAARFVLEGRRFRSYEWRMRAFWGSDGLVLRPLDRAARPGEGRGPGPVEVNVADHLDPDGVSDIRVRVEGERCAVTVNGKPVFEAEVGEHGDTALSFRVARGGRCYLRDLRVRDLKQ